MSALRNMATVYLQYQGKVLMLYRKNSKVISDSWIGSAGGHFEEWEVNDPKACVLRELQEELHMTQQDITDLQLRYICIRHVNDEIRINYYYFAELLKYKEDIPSQEGDTKWYVLNDIRSLNMPFTAKHMIDHYLSIGRHTTHIYTGTAVEDHVVFTPLHIF